MDGPRRPGPPAHPAGGDPAWRPSWLLLALAVGLVAGGVVYGLTLQASPKPANAPAPAVVTAAASVPGSPPPAPAAAASGPAQAVPQPGTTPRPAAPPAQRIARMRDPDGDQSPDLADYVNEGEKPTMAEVIDRLHRAGVRTGLGAFQPPGTRPPLVGLAVPEDYVLPEGYVRHYQATDDGQRIEPILMYSPDHRFVDAAGRPIAIPKDRVVPPEAAPPGLPIRRIVVPPPTDTGGPGR
ncbi:hypothetical protein [Ideonella sp. BN130291]|uniref:hypothetical protein n=1 Tax=Ideonella sp. BN130291 TaxID=3112940 RepID=UPI002E2626EC|nr:hypothetical protein [Ideonella sp. BN130291]